MKREHDKSYSCLVLLVFVKNIDKENCESIKQLIYITDKLGEKLGYKIDISYDTKISIINDMIKRGILEKGKRGFTQPISVKPEIREYILKAFADSVIMVEDNNED